jgi:hypothetical protein
MNQIVSNLPHPGIPGYATERHAAYAIEIAAPSAVSSWKNNKDTQQQLESSSSAGQAWSGFSKLKFFNGALYSYESK